MKFEKFPNFLKLTAGEIERGPNEIEREIVLFLQENNKISKSHEACPSKSPFKPKIETLNQKWNPKTQIKTKKYQNPMKLVPQKVHLNPKLKP